MTKETSGEELDQSLIYVLANSEQDTLDPNVNPEGTDEETSTSKEELPEKYRGKSAADIIKMHQEAERLVGKQGNEVGELRRIVDDLIHATRDSKPALQETEIDFFSDPKEATLSTVQKALANDPTLQSMRQDAEASKKERSAQALLKRHPDAGEISQDPQFGEWILKSKVRTNMFQTAHQNFDNEVAGELFDLWKDRKQVATETVVNAQANRTASVKSASTGGGRNASEVRGRPILSRERLIDLKIKNPDRYYAQMQMITEAYREGRVK